jgi:hypothetical protein
MAQDQQFPVHRLAGGVIVLAGLWHMVAPWVGGYSDFQPLVVSSLLTGSALVAFGGLRAAVRGMTWPIWACGVVAVWIIIAPWALSDVPRGLATQEALWMGLGVLGLVAVMAVDMRFTVTPRSGFGSRA